MGLIADLKSFASKFEQDLDKLWSKAPKVEQIAETTITFVGPILEDIFTVAGDGPAAAIVGDVVSKAEQDLTAVKALLTTTGATPSVGGIIAGVAANLGTLEAAANISDPKTVSNINLVVNELNALVAAFPKAATPVSTAPATPAVP
jgi:hypothetical protein